MTNNADVADDEAPFTANQWGICTYNLENMFDSINDSDGDIGDWQPPDATTYNQMILKRALGMAVHLEKCSVIGVEEMEGKDQVWNDLEAAMEAAAPGADFEWDYYESQDALHHGWHLLLCEQGDAEQQHPAAGLHGDQLQRQLCQRQRLTRHRQPWDDGGTYSLYDRPPYVANLTVSGVANGPTFTMIVNHFKSMSGGADSTRPVARGTGHPQRGARLRVQPDNPVPSHGGRPATTTSARRRSAS